MSDNECFDGFYAKLNDIVNFTINQNIDEFFNDIVNFLMNFLGEIYDQPKIVRKILRSLTEDFRPKVIAITESKDMDSIPVDKLVGSL